MPTEIIKTVKPSGGDYSSLSAWEAGEQGDLPTLDEIHTAECYSMQDTIAVIINGWDTSAIRYLKVYTPASERHDGKWNTGKYYLDITSGYALDIYETDAHVEGIQIDGNGTNLTNYVIRATRNKISYCISKDAGTSGYYTDPLTTQFWNDIAFDCNGAGFYLGSGGYFYNCTAKDNAGIGFQRFGGTPTLKNCLSDNVGADYSGAMTVSYCASGDATADDNGGAGNRINQTFTFVNEAGDDFHLASGDAGAKDYGVDLSADPDLAFSDDIDGQTRSGTWDIGADEYVTGFYQQALTGGLIFSGGLSKKTKKGLTGGLTFTGGLSKKTSRNLTGGLTFVGDILKSLRVKKNLTGELIFAGSLSTIKKQFKSLAGSLSFTGSLASVHTVGTGMMLRRIGNWIAQGVRRWYY